MRDQDELRSLPTATGSRLPDALREHGVDLDGALARALAARGCGGVSRAAHRAGAGARVARPAARRRPRHVRRRALALHVARPGGARRLDADGQAARRARRRGEARALHPRDRRARSAVARSARPAASSAGRGSSPRSSRRRSSCSTSAISMPARSRACSQLARDAADRFAAEENIEVEWERIWSIEPILFDEDADRLADEAVREVSGTSHQLPSGPVARRRRGLARRHPDGDALRPEPARPLAHEARGHEGGAPRAVACRRSTGWRRRRSPRY